MLYDDTNGDAFQVPQRAQGEAGDKVPDAPLQVRRRMVEDGIDGADGALLSIASADAPQAYRWQGRCRSQED